MKNKNKKIIIGLILAIVVILSILMFVFGFSRRNSNALTLEENKWIDQNKHNVVDIALLTDVPVLSYEGEGILNEYLSYVTDNHSLKFNIIPYKIDSDVNYNYKMYISDSVHGNEFELFKDNLILLTLKDEQFTNINEINNLKIGVLTSDKNSIVTYINDSTNTYIEYNSYSDLKNAIITSKNNREQDENAITEIDAVIMLKTVAMKEMIENDLNVAYHFNDLDKYFVLKTDGDTHLNNILKKTFATWEKLKFEETYNDLLLQSYYKFKKLSDVEQKTLKSKNYVYGFINYGIYNYLDGTELSGLNGILLKDFNKFSGLSITYTQYNSIGKLIDDFNSEKVDFMFNIVEEPKITKATYKTKDVFEKDFVIVSEINNDTVIDNLNSIRGKEVLTLRDSYLESLLIKNGIKYRSYNNMKDLVKDFNTNDIVVVDLENYNYYKTSVFENSRISYIVDSDDKYNYLINDKMENKSFEDIFDFYLSFNSINKIVTLDYDKVSYKTINITLILVLIILILLLYVVIDFSNHLRIMVKTIKKSKMVKLTKEEKIMYIDQLTSLKNRAYLNSRIESWDESEVYPQSIIVVDLNNISYINDNYGREEGDKVITEAANILIQNQLSNSEIIRTDGNEFLIYLVGYNEKQVISYLRKLSKEFKTLSHGFGAASGYSIIKDAIKTIDDAVNEATISMKENKEDIEY